MLPVSQHFGKAQTSYEISEAMIPEPPTVDGNLGGYRITPARASAQQFLRHYAPTIGIANGGEPPSTPAQ